jgi:hypothetical protein
VDLNISEFSFEVIVKLGRCNVGLDHLSRLELGKSGGVVDDQLHDADLFWIEAIPEHLKAIVAFLNTGTCRKNYFTT